LKLTELCRTTIKTGKTEGDVVGQDIPWTVTTHDCERSPGYPKCGVDEDSRHGHTIDSIVKKWCTCGKDLCNLGDAKGGNTVILDSYTILWIFFMFFTIDKECVVCEDRAKGEIDGGKSRSGKYAIYTSETCKEWRDEGNPKGDHFSMNCLQGESAT
jgi:hypothetical protein